MFTYYLINNILYLYNTLNYNIYVKYIMKNRYINE